MNTPTPRTDRLAELDITDDGPWIAHARQLERELAAITAERDQLLAVLVHADEILDDIDICSDAHKPMYSSYSQNVFKLCVKGRDARRAAIDAALREGTK